MSFDRVQLADVCKITMGQAPSGDTYNAEGEGLALIAGAGDFGELTPEPTKFTTSPTKVSRPGEIILCIRATIGDRNWSDRQYCLGRGVAGLLGAPDKLDQRFLWHWLGYATPVLMAKGRGATFLQVSKADIATLELPLPPLHEQRRIAAILDKVDTLRAKRRESVSKLDHLLQSVFLDMFGDPVANPKGWEMVGVAEMAEVLRDGPFGSNLKSEHYQPSGVRVIRLQNIGVWKFLPEDEAYISEDHFQSLPRNHCRPGDVLIGTLGDPNLRACILPGDVDRALNKADCLLFRAKHDLATAEYICGLLNSETLISSASGLALGQTRLRVSMGRLKELVVPMPPLVLQQRFSNWCERFHREREQAVLSLVMLDRLFESLQLNAFSGRHGEAAEAA